MQKTINGAMFKSMILTAAKVLEVNRVSIDALNVFPVPDGDTGTNMSLTIQSAVKELLIGSNTDSNNVTEGFMQMMQEQLDSALDTQGGYFNARAESLQSQISNMADKISKKEDQLLIYQEQITNQFTYMDQQIAQMQAQFTQLQQQLSSIGVSTGSS